GVRFAATSANSAAGKAPRILFLIALWTGAANEAPCCAGAQSSLSRAPAKPNADAGSYIILVFDTTHKARVLTLIALGLTLGAPGKTALFLRQLLLQIKARRKAQSIHGQKTRHACP
ncbi:MAG: hypothetical protein ABMA14_07510, partial [Hyphomonadaceae bacterium]